MHPSDVVRDSGFAKFIIQNAECRIIRCGGGDFSTALEMTMWTNGCSYCMT